MSGGGHTPGAITLRCDKCKREQAYDHAIDRTIPAVVATIVVSRCDRCDNGDFGMEWWLDASGEEIDSAAIAKSQGQTHD